MYITTCTLQAALTQEVGAPQFQHIQVRRAFEPCTRMEHFNSACSIACTLYVRCVCAACALRMDCGSAAFALADMLQASASEVHIALTLLRFAGTILAPHDLMAALSSRTGCGTRSAGVR